MTKALGITGGLLVGTGFFLLTIKEVGDALDIYHRWGLIPFIVGLLLLRIRRAILEDREAE